MLASIVTITNSGFFVFSGSNRPSQENKLSVKFSVLFSKLP